jgi:hypothetical protein
MPTKKKPTKKPLPALDVEFIITPNADRSATIAAKIHRQTVRSMGEPVGFGDKDVYYVASSRVPEIEPSGGLYLRGCCFKEDRREMKAVFLTLDKAKAAVAEWSKIIRAYKPPKPPKPPAKPKLKLPKPIVVRATSH